MSKEETTSSSSNGMTWDPKAEVKILEIAEQLKIRQEQAETIGRLCNEIIVMHEGKGGIKYGDKTFERIAKDPRIARNERQLRRYWHYYRLLNVAPYKNIEAVKKLKEKKYMKCVVYQLARIMQNAELDEKAKIELISKCGKAIMDNKLPVPQVEDMVTQTIDEKLALLSGQRCKSVKKVSKDIVSLEALDRFTSSLQKQCAENNKLDKHRDYSVYEINAYAKLLNVNLDIIEAIMLYKDKKEITAYLKPIAERISKMAGLQ